MKEKFLHHQMQPVAPLPNILSATNQTRKAMICCCSGCLLNPRQYLTASGCVLENIRSSLKFRLRNRDLPCVPADRRIWSRCSLLSGPHSQSQSEPCHTTIDNDRCGSIIWAPVDVAEFCIQPKSKSSTCFSLPYLKIPSHHGWRSQSGQTTWILGISIDGRIPQVASV